VRSVLPLTIRGRYLILVGSDVKTLPWSILAGSGVDMVPMQESGWGRLQSPVEEGVGSLGGRSPLLTRSVVSFSLKNNLILIDPPASVKLSPQGLDQAVLRRQSVAYRTGPLLGTKQRIRAGRDHFVQVQPVN